MPRTERRRKHRAVVAVGPAQGHAGRRATGVCDKVALGARLARVCRVRPRRRSRLSAGTDVLFSAARLQSSCPAPSRRSSTVRCRAARTPARCQSRKRRQHVMPEPHPISAGKHSHGSPVLSTNKMPVSAARFGTGGRPPLGRGGSGGSKGATNNQRSSATKSLAMPPQISAKLLRFQVLLGALSPGVALRVVVGCRWRIRSWPSVHGTAGPVKLTLPALRMGLFSLLMHVVPGQTNSPTVSQQLTARRAPQRQVQRSFMPQ